MTATLSEQDRAKRAAAIAALEHVESGMRLGLGTGSTADFFVEALGDKLRAGGLTDILCAPTSLQTGRLAEKHHIRLASLEETGWLDLTVDGADEVGPNLSLIKGGGGALLQEKIVATASDRMIVIADASKLVARLGAFRLPIEVVPFGWETTRAIIVSLLQELGWTNEPKVSLRLKKDEPFITDGGHFIFDLDLGEITDETTLDRALRDIPGVIDTGLFIGVADTAYLGHPDGNAERIGVEG